MKPTTLILILITLFSPVYGQPDSTTVYKKLKSEKFYAVGVTSNTLNGITTYKANGKEVSKSEYKKFSSTWDNMGNCCPCILKSYDENDNLLREVVACTDCGVGWFKTYYKSGGLESTGTYKENPTGDWDDIWNRGYCSVPNGKWTYFKENGDTLYSEYWDNGSFVKQVPEQTKAELWDVEIQLNGQDANELPIPIANVGDLIILPKYKNSNKDLLITIRFDVSAIGHRPNDKEFTLESFKQIDVPAILAEVEVPLDKETSFTLTVYSNGRAFKGFYLNIDK